MTQKIILANPRGFCAGVDRAIEIVNTALDIFGAPIYVRHEVVHNRFVVDTLNQRGAVFVDEVSDVPDDNTLIFSAHGVSQAVRKEAESRNLRLFDATCPLVTKVHLEVARYCRDGFDVILIGHAGHPEVEGTMGQYCCKEKIGLIHLVENINDVKNLEVKNAQNIAFVTQTTLSMDDTSLIINALEQRFPLIKGPKKNDICYATQNRQNSVKTLTEKCDLILVVGSITSSNSNRLKEIALKQQIPAYLIDGAEGVKKEWLISAKTIGITAGASAPEILVKGVIEKLKVLGIEEIIEEKSKLESIVFSLPKALRKTK